VIIILNDNGRSYAPTISNLTQQPAALTSVDKTPLPDRITAKL